MTINSASTSSNTASAMNTNSAKLLSSTKSSTSTTSTTELTDEEKNYDIDGDGVLSLTEEAAYLEAQAKQKALEANKSDNSSDGVSVSISDNALKMQKQGPPPPPPDVNEMSDDDLKSMLSNMKDKNGQLPKELSSYNDSDIDSLSDEDLSNIREVMTQMQERMAERKNHQPQNEQQSLMNQAITEYKKYSPDNFLSAVV